MDRSGGVVLKASRDHTKEQALRGAAAAHPDLALDKEHPAAPATPAAWLSGTKNPDARWRLGADVSRTPHGRIFRG